MRERHSVREAFSDKLTAVCRLNFFIHILPIPYGIVTAMLLSDMTTAAIAGEPKRVLWLAVCTIGLTILYRLLLSFLEWWVSTQTMMAGHRCKLILYRAILTSPLALLFASSNGELLEHVTDDLETAISSKKFLYPRVIASILTVTIYTVYMGCQSILVSGVLLLLSVMQIVPPIIIRKFLKVNYELNREVEAELTDFTITGYEGMATIKLYALEDWYLERMKGIHRETYRAGRKAEQAGALQSSMNSLVENLLRYGMYLAVGILAFIGLSSIETGIQAIALSAGLFGGIKTLFDCIPQFALVHRSEERLSPWFTGTDEFSVQQDPIDDGMAVQAQHVFFSYDQTDILHDVNLTIRKGELVLLKGKNGAGKTTLLHILTGLLRPLSGTVSYASPPASALWGDVLFYLPQEEPIYSLTAVELCEMVNLELGRVNFAEWRLSNRHVKDLYLSDLSGGERKKVYLALAFALNTPILILDEPTNSLDTDAVATLCRKLDARRATTDHSASSATLVISHDDRLSCLADRMYRLEKGELHLERAQ